MATEQRKFVDKAALNLLAQGLNTIIKNKIEAETTRATGIESQLRTDLDAIDTAQITANKTAITQINDADTGILKTANNYTDSKISEVNGNLTTLEGTVSTNTTNISGLQTTTTSQGEKISALETKVGNAKTDSADATGLYKDIEDVKTSISNIDLSSAVTEANGYTDQKITDLIGGAPEALDTLKELADKLGDDESAISSLTTSIAGKADKEHTHTVSDITDISTVGKTNSYSDLDDKPTLADFAYTNPMYSDIHTLEDAMNTLLYVAPSISSFTSSPSGATYEIGHVIKAPVTFSWTVNKTVISQSISNLGSTLSATDRNATYNGSDITTDKRFTLSVSDGKKSATRDINFTFRHNRYWGVSTIPGTYDSTFIKSLSNKEYATARTKSAFNMTAGVNQYMFYCFPTSWGTPTFNVGGFDGGFSKAATLDFTNASGNTTSFDIWKSENANLGQQTIVVK